MTLDDKEDVERTLECYRLHGGVVRFWDHNLETIYYRQPGGMQVTRTVDRALKSAQAIAARYPELVSKVDTKKNVYAEVLLKSNLPYHGPLTLPGRLAGNCPLAARRGMPGNIRDRLVRKVWAGVTPNGCAVSDGAQARALMELLENDAAYGSPRRWWPADVQRWVSQRYLPEYVNLQRNREGHEKVSLADKPEIIAALKSWLAAQSRQGFCSFALVIPARKCLQ